MENEKKLLTKIRRLLLAFMFLLLLSGLTAFPLNWELALLAQWTGDSQGAIADWIRSVHQALQAIETCYPYLSYGTDWLAFAHIVIAIAFIGPLRDPVRNIWVIHFGIIACLLVFPLAFICGPIRGIPLYWQLIDCSFGVFGFIPLYLCHRHTLQLEKTLLKHNV